MRTIYFFSLAMFISLNLLTSELDIVQYKEKNVQKINTYLKKTEANSVWHLMDLLKIDDLGQLKSIAMYDLLMDTIDNYRKTKHYITISDWVGLFATYLQQSYGNANLYTLNSGNKDIKNSYPIDLKWAIIPQKAFSKTNHISLSLHSRNGKIISPEEISSGLLPHSLTIKIIIDDFIDPELETEEIVENIFRSVKTNLLSTHNELNYSFIARKDLNDDLLQKILYRIEDGEIPTSPVMTGFKSQDPISGMLHRWEWSQEDNSSKYYSVLITGVYLAKHSFFTPPNAPPYFMWPKMEDFEKFKKFFMLSSAQNPENDDPEKSYFNDCYSDTLKRFETFNAKVITSESKKIRIQNLSNFLPELGGLSSPLRVSIFQNCFDTENWKFKPEEQCYADNKTTFEELLEKKNIFVAKLERLWTHMVNLLQVYYDRGFITYEVYSSRKIEIKEGTTNFMETDIYNIISRLFLDINIDMIDNKLLLQFTDNYISRESLIHSLKKLLIHYDNALINLADLYLTKDEDLIFKTKQISTQKFLTIDKDMLEIPIRYLEVENNEISFKRDRDILWGLVLAEAPIPVSRTQIQGSCASNAFLNVYSRLKQSFPDRVPWEEYSLLETIVSYSTNEYKDLRDGMTHGRGQNYYDSALRTTSNNTLTWVSSPAITREDTKAWLKEKFQNGQAIYFGTKINYNGFPFIDIINGGGHAVALVGMSSVPGVTNQTYIFVSDSNNYYYTIPIETFLDYVQYYISMDFGIASGDPSFNSHKIYGANATLKTIEFVEDL